MTISRPDAKPLKIVWVISDGIPGHFNQSKGVLLALKELYALKVEWVELRLKSGIYRRVLSWLLNRWLINQTKQSITLLSFFYSGKLPQNKPDIVIGAGGKSMFAVAWLGQALGAKSIFVGSLRQLKPALFDAVLILESSSQPPFIHVETAPMPISQSLLKQAATMWQAKHPFSKKPLWAMLVGGDGAGANYQESDWQMLSKQMNALAAQHDIQWLITTSRRTGAKAEQILKQTLNPDFLADAVWWFDQPRPVTTSYLGLSQVVYCTVDSMSMIMESVSAMRPVMAVIPQHFVPDQNFQNAMNRLQQQKLVLQSTIEQLNEKHSQLAQIQPLLQEPAFYLADQLKQRLQ